MSRRYEQVMRELIEAVVSGAYAERQLLPPVQSLRERHGASRDVVREALRGLEERGLIRRRAGHGYEIAHRERWDTRSPDVLLACAAHGPDRGVVGLAIDARRVIEREAARRATASATEADLALLAGRVEAMRRALEPGAQRAFDAGDPLVGAEAWFHTTLAVLTANPVLAQLVEPWHLPLATLRRRRAPERDGTVLYHHRRILEGLSSRDPALAVGAIDAYAVQLRRWIGSGR
jgi:GntR family transcriptional repressor for pyruvate dehydrogenase complex